jgi:hypothetical protein
MKMIDRLKFQEERLASRIHECGCSKKDMRNIILNEDNLLQSYCDYLYDVYTPIQQDMVERLEKLIDHRSDK